MCWKEKVDFFDCQFQQAPGAEGRAGTEAFAPAADCGEREDGQVAVHAPVRGIDGWNQTTQNGGSTYHLTPASYRLSHLPACRLIIPFIVAAMRLREPVHVVSRFSRCQVSSALSPPWNDLMNYTSTGNTRRPARGPAAWWPPLSIHVGEVEAHKLLHTHTHITFRFSTYQIRSYPLLASILMSSLPEWHRLRPATRHDNSWIVNNGATVHTPSFLPAPIKCVLHITAA